MRCKSKVTSLIGGERLEVFRKIRVVLRFELLSPNNSPHEKSEYIIISYTSNISSNIFAIFYKKEWQKYEHNDDSTRPKNKEKDMLHG